MDSKDGRAVVVGGLSSFFWTNFGVQVSPYAGVNPCRGGRTAQRRATTAALSQASCMSFGGSSRTFRRELNSPGRKRASSTTNRSDWRRSSLFNASANCLAIGRGSTERFFLSFSLSFSAPDLTNKPRSLISTKSQSRMSPCRRWRHDPSAVSTEPFAWIFVCQGASNNADHLRQFPVGEGLLDDRCARLQIRRR